MNATKTQSYNEMIAERRQIVAEAESLEKKALQAHKELDQDSRDAYLERAADLWLKADNRGRSDWCRRFTGIKITTQTTSREQYLASLGPR